MLAARGAMGYGRGMSGYPTPPADVVDAVLRYGGTMVADTTGRYTSPPGTFTYRGEVYDAAPLNAARAAAGCYPPPRESRLPSLPADRDRALYALAQGLAALARDDGPTAEREIAEALEYTRRSTPR